MNLLSNAGHYATTAGYYTTTAFGAFVSAHILEHAVRERPTLEWFPTLMFGVQCWMTCDCLGDIFRYQLPSLSTRTMFPIYTIAIGLLLASYSRMTSSSRMHRFEARMLGRINWIWGTATRFVDQVRNRLFPSQPLCQINPESDQLLEGIPAISNGEAMMLLRHALPHMGAQDRASLMQSSRGMRELAEGCIGKDRRETLAIRDFCAKILSSLKDIDELTALNRLNGAEVPFVQRLVRLARPEQLARVTHPRLQLQIETEALIQEKIREGITEDTTIDTLNTCPPHWRLAIAKQLLGPIDELKGSRQVAEFLTGTEDLSAKILVKHFPDHANFIWERLENLTHDDFNDSFPLLRDFLCCNSEATQNRVKEYLARQIEELPPTANGDSSEFCGMLLSPYFGVDLLSDEQIQVLKDHLATYISTDQILLNYIYLFLQFRGLDDTLEELLVANAGEGFAPPRLEISDITDENQDNLPLVAYNVLNNLEATWTQISNNCKVDCIHYLHEEPLFFDAKSTIASIVEHVIEHGEIDDYRLLIQDLLQNRNYWGLVKKLIDAHPKDSAMRNACIDEIRKCVHWHITPHDLPFSLLEAIHNILPQDEARKVYKSLAFGVNRTSITEEMLGMEMPTRFEFRVNQSRRDAETEEVFLSPAAHQVWQLATSLCALEPLA